jgi:hypothetical protein
MVKNFGGAVCFQNVDGQRKNKNMNYFVTKSIMNRSTYERQLSHHKKRKKIMKKLLLTAMISFGAIEASAYTFGSIYSNTIGNTTFHSGHIGSSNINVTTTRIGSYTSTFGNVGSASINLGTTSYGSNTSTFGTIGNSSLSMNTTRFGNSSSSFGSFGSSSLFGNSYSYGNSSTTSWYID